MFAATQVLKTMFVSVLDYGNIFLTGINQDKLYDLQKLQNDALRCCLNVKKNCDVHVNDIHEQLNLHLLDHRRTVQLLTCVRKCIDNNYLPYVKPEDVVLWNQSLKIKMPIPRNDVVKKSPYYWGSMIWNRLPEDLRLLDDTLLFKKTGGRSRKSYLMLVVSLDCVHQDTSIFILLFQKNAGTGILVCR